MTVKLRPYQEEGVAAIAQAFRRSSRVLFVLPTGGGKCLGRGTPILMFDGTIKSVEDVRPGDRLMGPDSRPRNVLSTCTGREHLYRVTPRKGDPYVVNESHVLSLRMTAGNRIGYAADAVVNIAVRDYLRESRTFKHCAKGWRAPVDFPPAAEPLPIPPYLMGVWLGDGSSRGFSITTGDPEIEAAVRSFAADRGGRVRTEPNSIGSVILHVVDVRDEGIPLGLGGRGNGGRGGEPLRNILKSLGVYRKKSIPPQYRTASRRDRLELLAGILDTDGHYTGKGFDLCLKDEGLFDHVLFVARSLGFAAYKTSVRKTCTNTGAVGDYFRCSISGDVDLIPCRIPRKQAAPRRQIKNPLRHGIALEPMGEGDYFGFTIDGDHLFMLGDFTVTHNTVIFTHIAHRAALKGNRVLILVHRVELLEQASRSLDAAGVPHGMIAAGRSLNLTAQVQVASVQTLAARLGRLPPDLFQFCIIDEAHHTAASTWTKVLDHFAGMKVLGVTATPCRSDGKGLGEWFDEIVLGPSPAWLTEHGYLAPARVFCPDVGLDTAGLRTRMGDFDLRDFSDQAGNLQITGGVVDHFRRHIGDGTAIAFCCSVGHAMAQAAAYRDAGIPAASIDGTMTTGERRELLADLGTGKLRVLTSCALIGEGVDVPSVTGCQFLRPTKSLSLHLQMIGRCLRPQPGKTAILLDHVGNFTRPGLGHHLEEREWTLEGAPKRDKKAAPSVKECPGCAAGLPSAARVCPECGHVFPVQEKEIVYVKGQLQELTGEDLARHRARKARGQAQTLDELVAVAVSQGMKNPHGWARHVMAARSLRAGRARIER